MIRIGRPIAIAAVACMLVAALPAWAQQQATRALDVGNATALRINVSGDLKLVPDTAATKITVLGTAPVGSPPLKVEATRTGRRLNISLSGPSRSPLPFTASGHSYVVTYPSRLRLEVREFAGGVTIAHALAPLDIYNADGAISLDGATASVTAEADNGDISASDVHSTIAVTTGTGNVSVHLARAWNGREVRIESSQGNLSLSVASDFRAHFDVTAADGQVVNGLPNDARAPLVFMLSERGNIAVARENL